MACVCDRLAGELETSPTCLGQHWVFDHLAPREMAALMDAAVRQRYESGQYIFFQGDPAKLMFLIKSGRVKLTKSTESGGEMTLDIRKAGDFLGENMLNEAEGLFPVTAVCLSTTLICGFTKDGFEQLVLDHPNIGLQVIKNLSRRIDYLTSRMDSLSSNTLEEKLYRVLINVAQEHGDQSPQGYVLDVPLTHEDLSFLVGAHRVSITRAMKGLKTAGRLKQEGRTLIVRPE